MFGWRTVGRGRPATFRLSSSSSTTPSSATRYVLRRQRVMVCSDGVSSSVRRQGSPCDRPADNAERRQGEARTAARETLLHRSSARVLMLWPSAHLAVGAKGPIKRHRRVFVWLVDPRPHRTALYRLVGGGASSGGS